MDPAIEKAYAIAKDFEAYFRNRDDAVIEKYSLDDLRHCRDSFPDRTHPAFNFLDSRIMKLEAYQVSKERMKTARLIARRQSRERWLDRLWGFLSGLVTGVVAAFVAHLLSG